LVGEAESGQVTGKTSPVALISYHGEQSLAPTRSGE
jgi:hypothetical protein